MTLLLSDKSVRVLKEKYKLDNNENIKTAMKTDRNRKHRT